MNVPILRSWVGLVLLAFGCAEPIDVTQTIHSDESLTGRPDLIVNKQRLASSLMMRLETFDANDCAVIEGCVTGTGPRMLLRFDTVTPNIGDTDLELGDPSGNPQFEFSSCHNHFHLTGYVAYSLLGADGTTTVVPGRKQAFCLRDSGTYISGAGPSSGFTCENQGLTAGWQDVYPRHLECQWLDVTGVPPGKYFLRMEVNPKNGGERLLAETRYDNNTVTVPFTIPEPLQPNVVTPLRPLDDVKLRN